ncbi:MAG: hypothetical protein DRM97_07775 [Thermoprotei archaeon]|nr:MAG: hypothetical protein DRM97_07775 [Thermoprotei archaeon]
MMSIETKFINRELEIEALRKLAYRDFSNVLYIYGPEGCGKTRLLREFINEFDGIGIYIDALERENMESAILLSPLARKAKDMLITLAEQVTGPVGRWLCTEILSLVERISLKVQLQDRGLVIMVDDVTRALGLDEIEHYIKWLYELRWRIAKEYRPKFVLIIATTSEGYSLSRVIRHTYNVANLLWNLNRDASIKLMLQLDPPSMHAIDSVWRLTGGNPRRIIEIATIFQWDIERWLTKLELELRSLVRIIKAEQLVHEVMQLIEDPDILDRQPTHKLERAYRILLESNLMMYSGLMLLSSWIEEDKSKWKLKADEELGIGEYYAWQIPAYKQVLCRLLKG